MKHVSNEYKKWVYSILFEISNICMEFKRFCLKFIKLFEWVFAKTMSIRLKFCTRVVLRPLYTNTTFVMTPAVPGGQGDDYLCHPQEFSIKYLSRVNPNFIIGGFRGHWTWIWLRWSAPLYLEARAMATYVIPSSFCKYLSWTDSYKVLGGVNFSDCETPEYLIRVSSA